ncbi:MAG TPA: hypothetical protein VN039_14030 [Nitrospira sp.]|nr:hypothetical protein [Nitrospira sp.]
MAWKNKLSSTSSNYDDLQYFYLSSKTGLNTDVDRMLQTFWASLSGLTPAQNYSMADHRAAALAQNPSIP